MENTGAKEAESSKTLMVFLWLVSLFLVGFISFLLGKSSTSSVQTAQIAGIATTPTQSAPIETPATATPVQSGQAPVVDLESTCDKTGPSQKKDYLVSYILKEGDTIQKIAAEELKDATRVSEITTLNSDQKSLTVGSTLYLPPAFIKQSSGNIFEVSGKIVRKDSGSWQLSYGGGEKGPGLWIPGFWFKDIPDINSYNIGDCVTILLDNGVKVYSVKKS